MSKLDEMWAALLAYLPQAISNGHGKSWAKMCSERTTHAADYAATRAAAAAYDADTAAYVAAYVAACAAVAVAAAADAADAGDYWAQEAIDKIKRTAVAKERNT